MTSERKPYTPAVTPAPTAAPTIVPASALGKDGHTAPSNRITVGIIGTGNQGIGDMKNFFRDDRVQVVAVCDVNRESNGYWDDAAGGWQVARRIADAHYSEKFETEYSGTQTYTDFRKLLAVDGIDAVEIATPDHWHAIMCVQAAAAGKDIYCQKPLALTIHEGRAIADAAKKNNRVFQTGSQQRSDPHFRRACELVRNGCIGKLHTVRCGLPGGRPDFGKTIGRKSPEPVPDGFDYDMWLGPAPWAEYAPARCHVNFRWNLNYSGGQITDWGGHHPDCAQWGMGTDDTGPIEIKNVSGEFPPDELWNTATEYHLEAVYANGVTMVVSTKERGGVTWEGTDGWVWADRGRHEASSPEIMESEIGPWDHHLYRTPGHFRNFIDCVISREMPICPAETAHRSITICHLGNIAMRLGRESLQWNPDTETIVGDDEAAAMTHYKYREPWTLMGG